MGNGQKPPHVDDGAFNAALAKQQNVEMCKQQILAILQKHSCVMIPVITLRGQGIHAMVEIVPKGPQIPIARG